LITIIWIWHCVAYGQLSIHSPYYIPYISTFDTQSHNHQNYDGTILGRNAGELLERSFPFQGAVFVKMKKLEAITANLAKQLKGIKTKYELEFIKRFIRESKYCCLKCFRHNCKIGKKCYRFERRTKQ
jgi:hypothetical protein